MTTLRKPTAYWDYIRVEEMLALQSGLEETDAGLANDEVMFIVVHQSTSSGSSSSCARW